MAPYKSVYLFISSDDCDVISWQLDSLIHEIGHAIGLWHEQARTDRDAHILIKWNHMKPAFKYNFEKRRHMQWLGPYDFSSIMHYDNKVKLFTPLMPMSAWAAV